MNGQKKKITYTLLYRGSRDGFGAAEFHKRCDGKGPTISFIESLEHKQRFGGFTSLLWSSNGSYGTNDATAFLFSLDSSKKFSIHK